MFGVSINAGKERAHSGRKRGYATRDEASAKGIQSECFLRSARYRARPHTRRAQRREGVSTEDGMPKIAKTISIGVTRDALLVLGRT